MKTIEIPAPDFDLAKTLDSGQVFHWEKADAGFVGTIGDQPVYVEQAGAVLKLRCELDCLNQSSFHETEDATSKLGAIVASASSRSAGKHAQDADVTVSHYFALDHPLTEICASFPNDPVMNAAREFCHGLRIIRQPKWECLATFICSSMKQVAHIRQISRKLRERFGAVARVAGRMVYTFPTAHRIAETSEKELRVCALGYRAPNLLRTARLVVEGDADLEAWSTLSDAELRERLCHLPGVGAKVANCVMLFAYERLGAFPIDVWIERVLRQNYFPRARKLNAARLRAFTQGYFGEHGGYAQQYLFHHARKTAGRGRTAKAGDKVRRRNLSPSSS